MEELIKQLESYGYEVTVGPSEILVVDHGAKLYGKYDRDTADFNTILKDLTGGTQ